MQQFFISLALGLSAALIDVLPMIIRKLDRAYIMSAFFVWLGLGLIIPAADLIPISALNGLVIAALMVIPLLFLVARLDREAIPIMIVSTLILGSALGTASGFLFK